MSIFISDVLTSCATDEYVIIAGYFSSPDWQWKSVANKEPAQVTDNARNISVGGVVTEITLHLICLVHTLHPASQKAFKWKLLLNIEKIRKVVDSLHWNARATKIIYVAIAKLPTTWFMTQWNSSCDMLKSFGSSSLYFIPHSFKNLRQRVTMIFLSRVYLSGFTVKMRLELPGRRPRRRPKRSNSEVELKLVS